MYTLLCIKMITSKNLLCTTGNSPQYSGDLNGKEIQKRGDIWASQVVPVVKNLPTNQEMGIRSLGWDDLLEKEMATHSSILAWEIPWTEEPGGLQSMQSHKSWTRLSD